MINALELRKRVGWNQRDMSLYLGCSQAMVCRIEKGRKANGSIQRLLAHLMAEIAAGRIPTKEPTRPHSRARARTRVPRAEAGANG